MSDVRSIRFQIALVPTLPPHFTGARQRLPKVKQNVNQIQEILCQVQQHPKQQIS